MNMDLLLTVVGLGLVAVGVGVFLFGRSRPVSDDDRNNVFEAFGIKLDVANPSILLIMFGVVMMLTPRFVPLDQNLETQLAQADESVEPAPPPASPAIEIAAPEMPEVPQAPEPVVQTAVAVAEEPLPTPSPVIAEQPRPVLPAPAEPVASPPPAVLPRAIAEAPPTAAGSPPPAPRPVQPEPQPQPQPQLVIAKAEPQAEPEVVVQLPRLVVLAEALHYEGETDDSLRGKINQDLGRIAGEMLDGELAVEQRSTGFRKELRSGDVDGLCKSTQADRLLLADLTPVEVESFTADSANWPDMRYSAVNCRTGRVLRSDQMRMVPTVGDRYPLQQSVADSAREFVADHRYLLEP